MSDLGEYELRKSLGICPRCKGDPKPGRVCCAACIAKVQAWQVAHPASTRDKVRAFRHRRIAAGLCWRCGALRTAESKAVCGWCLELDRRRKRNGGFVKALMEIAI